MGLVIILALLLLLQGNTLCMKTYKEGIETKDFSWISDMGSSDDVDTRTLEERLMEVMPKGAVPEDMDSTFEEIVARRGYPVETHQVRTEDGYLLTLHRIPHGLDGPSQNRPVAFLQHGLLCSSIDWIIPGPSKALAYLLANRGYDVWLGNARGNTYSRRHETLDPDRDAREFWDFSWDEIGYYDIPAMIDYALAYTGQQSLFHIGHSQGTTSFYVMAARRPEYNAKIRAHFSLSPVAYMGNAFSPIFRMLAVVDSALHAILQLIGVYEFLPTDGFLAQFASQYCAEDTITQMLCTNSLFAVAGFSRDQMNTTLLPIIVAHTPAGAATKQLVHYGQLINSGRFRRWDFGLLGNNANYGSRSPPSYDLSQITAPVYFFYSRNDWLSHERDVLQLERELPNMRGKFLNPDPRWNHLDYTYGIDIDIHINHRVVSLMTRH